ncbi:metal-dependent hydrolase [Deferribacter abyssi]|uniref:metal-dependent hydrolase n=1 Tax=Deferribacter abyssi TaxID=213806 RepID=UPI003C1E74F0
MVKIKWLGHAAVLIQGSKRLLIDPYLKENPKAKIDINELAINYILITHGHPDHLGDAILLAKEKKVPVLAIFEITAYLQSKGISEIIPMNIGGKKYFEFGWVKMVPAVHSSSIIENERIIYAGNSAGFVINIDSKIIYVAGDTALFKDMELIGEILKPEIAVLPVGGNFTMDIEEAIHATKILNVKKVIPVHYDTWDTISTDIEEFKDKCKGCDVEPIILEVNEEYEL